MKIAQIASQKSRAQTQIQGKSCISLSSSTGVCRHANYVGQTAARINCAGQLAAVNFGRSFFAARFLPVIEVPGHKQPSHSAVLQARTYLPSTAQGASSKTGKIKPDPNICADFDMTTSVVRILIQQQQFSNHFLPYFPSVP